MTRSLLVFLCALMLGGCIPWHRSQWLNSDAESDSGDDWRPRIASGANGTTIAVWESLNNPGGTPGTDYDILFSRWAPDSTFWGNPAGINSDTATDASDDQNADIATDGNGNWVVVWQAARTATGSDLDIYCAASTNDGDTWSAPAAISSLAAIDASEDYRPRIQTNRTGAWVVTWQSANLPTGFMGADQDIFFARSVNNGGTWTAAAHLNTNASTDSGDDEKPRLAYAGGTKWVCAWVSKDSLGGTIGTDADLLYSRSVDHGVSWGAPAALNSDAATDGHDDGDVSITGDDAGSLMAVWYAPGAGFDLDINFTRSTNSGVSWTPAAALNNYAPSDSATDVLPEITTDRRGNWMTVWHSDVRVLTRENNYNIMSSLWSDRTTSWTVTSPVNVPGSYQTEAGHDITPTITTDFKGTWFCPWQSDEIDGGDAPSLDDDIAFSGAPVMYPVRRNPFSTYDEGIPGGGTGWVKTGQDDPALAQPDYDATYGAYRVRVASNSSRFRLSGWFSNRTLWLPYSSVGTNRHVRAKYFVYATGQADPAQSNQIPNFRLRVGNRYAATAVLEVTHHQNADPGNAALARELRPSTNPLNPSLYRVDMDVVDVPFLVTSTTDEGLMRGFEAISFDPQDNGYIGMTESNIGVYPAWATSPYTETVQEYNRTFDDAGQLKVFNSATDLKIATYIMPGSDGGTVTVDPSAVQPTYSESNLGVTFDSAGVATDRLGMVHRDFFPGPTQTQRARVEAGEQYAIRFHVTSTQFSNRNSNVWLKARSAKFAWSTRLELGGAFGTGGLANNTIAQQTLPGIGCMNFDKTGGEDGGWYTILMNSPMDPDIRPEFPHGTPIQTRMPNLAAQPAYEQEGESRRDIKVGATLYDTLSAGTGKNLEVGNFRIDSIEIRRYYAVPD